MFNSDCVIYKEKFGSNGEENVFVQCENQKITLDHKYKGFSVNVINGVTNALKSVFLPHGYPDSVSEDYIDYQIWDTVQAFCSTITSTFTTQAILKGVGVGDTTATPLAAAVTWVLKDGSGMIGRITFAWWKGNSLDADCKKWRIFADVLNDTAIFLEFLLPLFADVTVPLLCLTSVMKAIVGVAGGATRASITQHQAIRGNMADVSAKDASQETCVNLFASLIGIFLLTLFENQIYYQWAIFLISTAIHLFANYFAVRSLVFKHLNEARLLIVLETYLKNDTVANPIVVNKKEPLIGGFSSKVKSFCGYDIKLGASLADVLENKDVAQIKDILHVFADRDYTIIPDLKNRVMYISLGSDAQSQDIIMSNFHAVMLAIALCRFNKIELNFNAKRQLRHITPLQRLDNLMKSFPTNNALQPFTFPLEKFISFQEFINAELISFFTALNINGWDIHSHSLNVGEWRCNYNMYKTKKSD